MLTLFKPWRSGIDLKAKDYSWDETFNDHQFTSRQQELLSYFNIRYECNDARDDYSAQLKKGDVLDGAFPQWMSSGALNDLDDTDPYDQGADFGDNDPDDEAHDMDKYSGLGKYGRQRQEEMDATKIGITEAGWLNDSPNGIAEIDKTNVKPTVQKSGTQWKVTVAEMKQKELADRNKNIPVNKSSTKAAVDPNENNVKVCQVVKFARINSNRTMIFEDHRSDISYQRFQSKIQSCPTTY
jgi:hypothetical protein